MHRLRCLRECVSQADHFSLCLPGAPQAHRHVLQPQKGRGYAAGLARRAVWGCGKCVRNCPVQAIYIRDNVARVDYTKCVGCGKCAKDCPVGSILIPKPWKA